MQALLDDDGEEAELGKSHSYWLLDDDFVCTEPSRGAKTLGVLGFPRDWPSIYSHNKALKSLIGKKGRIPGKRAGVVTAPTEEDRALVEGLVFRPLQSFANAERVAGARGLAVVRGWAIFECHDLPPGTTFVAERYWWNASQDGRWTDFTPRPDAWPELLLSEAAEGAPKLRTKLTKLSSEITSQLFRQRFQGPAAISCVASSGSEPLRTAPVCPPGDKPVAAKATNVTSTASVAKPVPSATSSTGSAAKVAPKSVKLPPNQAAAPVDYSKWSKILDSDDEEEHPTGAGQAPQPPGEDYGVRDMMEDGHQAKPQSVPEYLVGNTGGGGGTNCFSTICKLLDMDFKKGSNENGHQLSMALGKGFRCGIMDSARQAFYRRAIESIPSDTFVIVMGMGSTIPMLSVARRCAGRALLLEGSERLASVAEALLKANSLSMTVRYVSGGLDNAEQLENLAKSCIPAGNKRFMILTERLAHDMLSNGIVPISVAMHQTLRALAPQAEVKHIPRTVELYATPAEIRFEKLGRFDVRPFNAFRDTATNDKADFWWWPVRLDNQAIDKAAMLGPSQTLCGFDFDRSPEIALNEVRRPLKLQISSKGRCNAVALWWTARFGDCDYSTKPMMAKENGDTEKKSARGEWKQAVHYLGGETAVYVGDTVEALVSISPRFTFRMMQQSPFSTQTPPWIRAPTSAKFSATLPVLPYHFLMLTDVERLEVYGKAIREAVKKQRAKLGRRPRVLDVGCGAGLLGMTAAFEGAEVWLCEAVPMMRRMCREVVAANAAAVVESRGLVRLLPPMMSSSIKVGEDVEDRFDIVISEVMDLWCLGEGVIPTMKHACENLLAPEGVMLPHKLHICAQPVELDLWSEPERDRQVTLAPLSFALKSKYSPLRIQQVPHRWLSASPMRVLDIDLYNVPAPPEEGRPNIEGVNLCIRMGGKPALQAKVSSTAASQSGMLCGFGIWWEADLGNGHVVTTDPMSPQRSWKQLVRWLEEPRFVCEGECIQVLSCFNDQQFNVDDVHMPREMVEQVQEQLRAEGQLPGPMPADASPAAVAPSKSATAAAKPEARAAAPPQQSVAAVAAAKDVDEDDALDVN